MVSVIVCFATFVLRKAGLDRSAACDPAPTYPQSACRSYRSTKDVSDCHRISNVRFDVQSLRAAACCVYLSVRSFDCAVELSDCNVRQMRLLYAGCLESILCLMFLSLREMVMLVMLC